LKGLLNFSFKELKQELSQEGFPVRIAYQIFNWVYRKFVYSFEDMSDISKEIRLKLSEKYKILELKIKDKISSSDNETVKFLFETEDGLYIETVIISAFDEDTSLDGSRLTLCVSSQVGCPLNCRFCATGKLGFKRNLSAGEIISQILLSELYIKEKILKIDKSKGRKISNIVFMGMGEPLLNYEEVLKSVHILNFSGGYNLGSRHITISTAGIIPLIEKLSQEKEQLRLAVSLHSANQKTRETLMPISRENKLSLLVEALEEYQKKTLRRITFEYILIPELNDSEEEVLKLKELLEGLDYNLNIIAYNPVEGFSWKVPEKEDIENFTGLLKKHRIPYVFRKSKGSDIKAGCGQLGMYWKNGA